MNAVPSPLMLAIAGIPSERGGDAAVDFGLIVKPRNAAGRRRFRIRR